MDGYLLFRAEPGLLYHPFLAGIGRRGGGYSLPCPIHCLVVRTLPRWAPIPADCTQRDHSRSLLSVLISSHRGE